MPHGCAIEGPFREGVFFIPETIGEDCLKRNFDLSCSLTSKEKVNGENFTVFEIFIRETIHRALHDCVDGHMLKHHSASFTAEFWIHHSFVDKIWADRDWQMKRRNRTFVYFTVSFVMTMRERFPWELLDNHGLSGDVRFSYEHPGDSFHDDEEIESFVWTQNKEPDFRN